MAISTNLIKSFQLSALTTALALAGCGGGGGNDTLPPPVKGGGTGSTSTSAIKISAISLIDVNGKTTMTVNSSGVNAKLTVTDASGKAISGAMVTFTATGGVTFGTSNGAVLTNANGEASISVKPTNTTDTGAYSISATAVYNDKTATTAASNFSLQPANISLSSLAASNTSLSSGGTTNITLVTLDANTNTVLNDIVVNFSATCGTFANNSVTSSNQGNITTTYKAINTDGKLCEGTQTITATNSTGTVSKTIALNIAAIQANSIIYSTDKNVSLVARGSGSSTSDTVEFTVYANGTPAANKQVIISKNYAPSDFSFGTLNNQSDVILTSDSDGKITLNVYPGNLPGPVELKAALASNSSIYALSKNLTVVNSRASQNGVTLAFDKNVLLNNTADSTTITMHLTNRNGTNVPAGTVVNFIAEGGRITPSCSTDTNGECKVIFTSQNPRPIDGRVSVLAYLEGDKDYYDVNGDNAYTAGVDTLTRNIGDAYRDDNENNSYNSTIGEFIYRRGATGSCGNTSFTGISLPTDFIQPDPNNILNRSLLTSNMTSFLSYLAQPNIDNTCDTGLAATLRHQEIFGFANETPTFDWGSNNLFYMYGNSEKTVSMPSGTTIAVSTEDNTKDNNAACTATLYGNVTVPNNVSLYTVNSLGNFFEKTKDVRYSISLKECAATDKFTITVTAPNGKVTNSTYTL